MRKTLQATAIAAMIIVGSNVGRAGIISNVVEVDLDLATITDDGAGGQLIIGFSATGVPITPFTALVGDVLQTTITFAHGDRLRIIDGPNTIDDSPPDFFESLVFYFQSGTSSTNGHTTLTTNAVFSNLQGNLTDLTPGSSSTGILAQAIGFDFTNSEISFDGITLTTTISAQSTPFIYDSFGLWGGRAGGFEIVAANSVPEPSSIALLGTGVLGLCGYRLRRRSAGQVV
jgi:hypothetical protein